VINFCNVSTQKHCNIRNVRDSEDGYVPFFQLRSVGAQISVVPIKNTEFGKPK
jgi:hypothetical protein